MGIYADALMETDDFEKVEKPPESPSALVKDFQQESQQFQMGLNFQETTGVNPDEHAEAIELSKEVKLPPDFVRKDLQAYREQSKQQKVDYSKLLKESPALSKVLTDPDFTKVAADDLDGLQGIERIFRQGIVDPAVAIVGKAPIAFSQALVGISDLSLGLSHKAMGAFYDVHKENIFDPMLEFMGENELPEYESVMGDSFSLFKTLEDTIGLKFGETQKTMGGWLSPETKKAMGKVEKAEGFMDTIWEYASNPSALSQDILTSWPHLVASMGVAKNAIQAGASQAEALLFAHVTEGLLTAGSMNASLQEQGVSPEDARKYSAGAGAMTGLIGSVAGKLGLGDSVESLLIPKKVDKAIFATAKTTLKEKAKTLSVEAGKGFVQEGLIEEGLQNVSEQFFENLATGKPAFEGLGKAYAQGVAVGGPMGSMMNVAGRIANDSNVIQTAQNNQETMEALGDSVKASKLRERSSAQFQQFIDETTKDGPVENIYISAEKFDEYFQTQELDLDQVLEELPDVRAQIEQARERNGDIVIPINEYAGKIAGTEHHAGLIQDIKFNPTELTPREAAQLKQDLPEILQDYIKSEQEILDREIKDQDSYDRILEAATDMQVEAGELRTQSTKRAELLARTFTTIGERYNLDPVQLFEGYGIEVRGPTQQEVAKVDNLDTFIEQVRADPKTEEGAVLIEHLSKKGVDLATATNEEVKMALEGDEQPIAEKVVEYDQFKDYQVKTEAIEEETGRTISISENADIALQEVDDSISTLQELIECVSA